MWFGQVRLLLTGMKLYLYICANITTSHDMGKTQYSLEKNALKQQRQRQKWQHIRQHGFSW